MRPRQARFWTILSAETRSSTGCVEAVSEVCKGNALFLEETVRALAETGKLEGQPGRYRPSGEVGQIGVSQASTRSIDSRFERLDGDAKRVAEVASIFGGEIPVLSLQRMATLPSPRFDAALQSLKKADLLWRCRFFRTPSVRFKHALIRDAISGRIVSSALVELHKVALAELKDLLRGQVRGAQRTTGQACARGAALGRGRHLPPDLGGEGDPTVGARQRPGAARPRNTPVEKTMASLTPTSARSTSSWPGASP